ncbi:MAG: Hsp33 family molecular chaperone HslO [Clostridia bacterium]|nr:Hsp33 family molecular chaperone HslO [Clostridia bacterium]
MNKILKTLIYDKQLSLAILDTTDMVNDAIKIHKLSPLSAAALGRTMTVTTFMASTLKNASDKLSVTIKGDGVGGEIVVCGNSDLKMRGYIENPYAELPIKENGHLDVGGCVGKNGRITVVKSMGLKEPYSGTANLITGEIAEDFTAYFTYSEQMPTAMALGVKIGTDGTCVGAGGVVIQALPGASDEALFMAEDTIMRMGNISTLIEEKGIDGVADYFFGDYDYVETFPEYKCLCSRDYIEKLLISMGKDELYSILNERGTVEVNCQFCETDYKFNKDDIDKLLGL